MVTDLAVDTQGDRTQTDFRKSVDRGVATSIATQWTLKKVTMDFM